MSGRDRLLHPGAGHHGVHGPARPAHPLLQILPLLLRLHGQLMLILNEKEAIVASNKSFKEFEALMFLLLQFCGSVQMFAAVLFSIGLLAYPAGWGSEVIKQLCGPQADAFILGSCQVSEGEEEIEILDFNRVFVQILRIVNTSNVYYL